MFILATINPPKAMVNRTESIYANFLWGESEHRFKHHWVSQKKCRRPINKGSFGIRSIHDIVNSFSIKLWWQLRTTFSSWAQFMKNKYSCNGHLSDCIKKLGTSLLWQRMKNIKLIVEDYMRWILGEGSIDFSKDM